MFDTIEVHAKPTPRQIALAQLHLFVRSGHARTIAIASVALVALSWSSTGKFEGTLAIGVGVTWIILPIVIVVGALLGKTAKDISTYGATYQFSPSGIEWNIATATGRTSGVHEWSVIKRWKETNDLFLLFTGMTVVVLPKNTLPSSDATDSLRLLFRCHIAQPHR